MVMVNGSDRIKVNFKSGVGDLGFSKLLDGETEISKSHVACELYGTIEILQHLIGEAISEFSGTTNIEASKHEREIELTLKWLYKALFSLSSHCWCRGETERHSFPVEFFQYIEERSNYWKEQSGRCADFLIYSDPKLLAINKVRIWVRKVEVLYVRWWESPEMSSYLRQHPEVQNKIRYQEAILNRLSLYFWAAGRMESKLLGIKETPWAGSMPEFVLPIK